MRLVQEVPTWRDAGLEDDEDVDDRFELPDPDLGELELVVNDKAHDGTASFWPKPEVVQACFESS